jgi:hypothetical protein
VKLTQLVFALAEREAPVEVDLLGLGVDVVGRNVGVDLRVDTNRAADRAPGAGQLGDRLAQELQVELEADRSDVTGLLGAE